MPFQILASIFMIITLYIYHGYEKDELSQDAIDKATKNMNVAITFLYVSRFLSGFAAGMLEYMFIIEHCTFNYLFQVCVV
jgi:hypothetical protein